MASVFLRGELSHHWSPARWTNFPGEAQGRPCLASGTQGCTPRWPELAPKKGDPPDVLRPPVSPVGSDPTDVIRTAVRRPPRTRAEQSWGSTSFTRSRRDVIRGRDT